MLVLKIKDGNFFCGFCKEITKADVIQSTGNGKHKVSNQIICKKCGAHIAQKNQIN